MGDFENLTTLFHQYDYLMTELKIALCGLDVFKELHKDLGQEEMIAERKNAVMIIDHFLNRTWNIRRKFTRIYSKIARNVGHISSFMLDPIFELDVSIRDLECHRQSFNQMCK